jgi:transcriptional regulator of acetoin/glycerol metabolism
VSSSEPVAYAEPDRANRAYEQIIGNSPALESVLKQVEYVAPTDSTVLIQGETGTGKELIARAIHNASPRCGRALVKLNCAAIERLGSGRTHKVNVRLVAATNRDLGEMAARNEFRSDLYYRLNVFPISLPPLRERREDIPALLDHFADIFGRRMSRYKACSNRSPRRRASKSTACVRVAHCWPDFDRNIIQRIGARCAHDASRLRTRAYPPDIGSDRWQDRRTEGASHKAGFEPDNADLSDEETWHLPAIPARCLPGRLPDPWAE